MKPEKNGGACAAPAAGDRNGEGVPCRDARREADSLGDSPPDALRGCDDDLAELGRCEAGDPGVLGLRPGAPVTVLGMSKDEAMEFSRRVQRVGRHGARRKAL
jgi:hypothetical protein